MKVCHVCRRTPDEGASFACDRSKPGGLANKCRQCNAAKCRAWYGAHRGRQIARVQGYKAAKRAQWETRKWEICQALVDGLARCQGRAR